MQYASRFQSFSIAAILFIVFALSFAIMPRSASAAAVTIGSLTASSTNASTTLAKVGSTVNFQLNLSGTPAATTTPVISIFNMGTSSFSGSGSTWTYSTTSASNWTEGLIAFNVAWGGTAGEATTTFQSSATTTANVTFDKTGPVITIIGSNPDNTTVYTGSYTNPGATASDSHDGTVSVVNSGSVNRSAVGAYTLTYVATDAAGNTSTSTRTVNVAAAAAAAVSTGDSGGPIAGSLGGSIIPTAPGTNPIIQTSAPGTAPTGSGNATQIATLQAQLQTLLAQIAALGSGSASFSRDLQLGSTGSDVMALQVWLNGHGYPVATSGAGSSGNETTKFGALTKKALAAWQASVGISPASGYFGPKTRAYLAAHS